MALDITSDRGPQSQFISGQWSGMARSFGVQVHRTTAYHCQASGLSEHFHCSLKAAFCGALADGCWVDDLPWIGARVVS